MEKNIIAKINKNSSELKKNMIDWIKKNNVNISDDTGRDKTNEFIEHISDFPTIQLTKDDFKRRTRIKTVIPNYERCCALKLNGDQCTRKNKDKQNFCGTHIKGLPYGKVNDAPAKRIIRWKSGLKKFAGFINTLTIITTSIPAKMSCKRRSIRESFQSGLRMKKMNMLF